MATENYYDETEKPTRCEAAILYSLEEYAQKAREKRVLFMYESMSFRTIMQVNDSVDRC
jgi:predicted adenine nucleotide alpha hydrolase (AANH) superfamily ATPase